jgi:hypothetical protein
MSAIVQEQPKQDAKAKDDRGTALVAQRFPAEEGWRNVNVFGHSWRCNKWRVEGFSGFIAESRFVTATPDGLVVHEEEPVRKRASDW